MIQFLNLFTSYEPANLKTVRVKGTSSASIMALTHGKSELAMTLTKAEQWFTLREAQDLSNMKLVVCGDGIMMRANALYDSNTVALV